MANVYVRVSGDPINLQSAYDFVSDPGNGAVDVFVGAVRDQHNGELVTGITYDAHEGLAEKAIKEICAEAQQKWGEIKIYIAHFKGELKVGGISIVIAVGSPHRAESFDACRFIIEEVKKRVPVWKHEHYGASPSVWLPGQSLMDSLHG